MSSELFILIIVECKLWDSVYNINEPRNDWSVANGMLHY